MAGFFTALFLFSCGQKIAVLQDGYYTAEAAEFDAHGWKEYVMIYVSRGRILTVEYNAFNASGFIKSWDMDYMRVMESQGGIYPNSYTRQYAEQLISKQGVEWIDALTGATESHNSFIQLAGAAIEYARSGNTATGLVAVAEAAKHDTQTETD